MWKRYVNLLATLMLLGAFGFLVPFTFSRRLTLTGILACLAGLGLAVFCASVAAYGSGIPFAIAAWAAINLLTAGLWIWLVFRVTTKMSVETH